MNGHCPHCGVSIGGDDATAAPEVLAGQVCPSCGGSLDPAEAETQTSVDAIEVTPELVDEVIALDPTTEPTAVVIGATGAGVETPEDTVPVAPDPFGMGAGVETPEDTVPVAPDPPLEREEASPDVVVTPDETVGAADPPPSAPAPDPPAGEPQDDALSDEEVALIGQYQRTRDTLVFGQDEVFVTDDASEESSPGTAPGAGQTGDAPPPRNPFQAPGAAKPAGPQTRGERRPMGASAVDPSDPFASLGSLGASDKGGSKSREPQEDPFVSAPSSTTRSATEVGGSDSMSGVDFSGMLSDDKVEGDVGNPFEASFGPLSDATAMEQKGQKGDSASADDPFSVPDDPDTFFVEAPSLSDGGGSSAGTFELDGGAAAGEGALKGDFPKGGELRVPRVGQATRIGSLALLVVVTLGLLLGLFTDYGWFGIEILYPPRQELAAPTVPVVVEPDPTKRGSLQDTTRAFLKEIVELENGVKKAPQDIEKKRALLMAYLQFITRFPAEYDVNRGRFRFSVDQLKKEVGFSTAPRLQALEFIRQKDYAAAKTALDKALAEETASAELQFLYGQIAFEQGKHEDAIHWFNKASQQDTSLIKALYFAGRVLEDQGKYDEATEQYVDVLKQNPSHNAARFGMIRVRIGQADLAGAQSLAAQALDQANSQENPEDQYLAHRMLAQVFAQQDQLGNRLKHLMAAIQLKPSDSELVVELIDHYAREKNASAKEEALLSAFKAGCAGTVFYKRLVHHFLPTDLDKAEQYAMYAEDTHPNEPSMLFLMAEVSEARGHSKNARSIYRKIISKDGAFADAYVRLAAIYTDDGRVGEAIRVLSDGLKVMPNAIDLMVRLADTYARTAQTIKAKSVYERLLEKDPNNTQVRMAYAMLLTDIGYGTEAIAQFEMLYSQGMLNNDVTVGYARALARAQRSREAVAELSKLLKVQPQNIQANTQMGALHIGLQSYRAAANYLNAALRVAPNHTPALFAHGRLARAKGDEDSAISYFMRAVEAEADNIMYRYELATALAAVDGRHGEAESHLDAIIERYESMRGAARASRNPNVYKTRGEIFFARGDFDKALKDFEAAMLIDTSNIEAISGLAETLFKLNRIKEAEAYFKEIVSKDKENATAHFYLGKIAQSRGKARDAENHLLVAVKRGDAVYAEAHKTLGYMFRERRMSAPARRHFQLYLRDGQPSSEDRDEVERVLARLR